MVSSSFSVDLCQIYDLQLPDFKAEEARNRIMRLCLQRHQAFIRRRVVYPTNSQQKKIWEAEAGLYKACLLKMYDVERRIFSKIDRYEDPAQRLKRLREEHLLFATSAHQKARECYDSYISMLIDSEKEVLQHSERHLTACHALYQIDSEDYRHTIEGMKRQLDVVDPLEEGLRCIRLMGQYKIRWNHPNKTAILLALSVISGVSINEETDIDALVVSLSETISTKRLQQMLSSPLSQVKMIARRIDLSKKQLPRLTKFVDLQEHTTTLIANLETRYRMYDQRMANKDWGLGKIKHLSGQEIAMLATPHLFNLVKAHLEMRVKAYEGLASIGCFSYNTLGRCLFDRLFIRTIQATHKAIRQQRKKESLQLCLYAIKFSQQLRDQGEPLLISLLQQLFSYSQTHLSGREIRKFCQSIPASLPVSSASTSSTIERDRTHEQERVIKEVEEKEEKKEKLLPAKPSKKALTVSLITSNSLLSSSPSSSSSSSEAVDSANNGSWILVRGFEYHSRVKRWELLKRKTGDKIPFEGYEKLSGFHADRAYLSHLLPPAIETLLFDPNFCMRRSVQESDDARERFHLIAGMSYHGEGFRLGIVTYSIVRKGMQKICIHRHFSEQPNERVINKENRANLLNMIDEQLDKELAETTTAERENLVGDAEVALEYIELPPDPAFDFRSFYCSQYDTKIIIFPQ